MDDIITCPICLDPIVTKTRQNTHFKYRCGHLVHTRCAAQYLESRAPVATKFQCPMCRGAQSTWFPARLCRTRAVQCTKEEDAKAWEEKTVAAFMECAYINALRPSRIGFSQNLKMIQIPAKFDEAKCTKSLVNALVGMLGKKSFGSKERFDLIVRFMVATVANYIKVRELTGRVPHFFRHVGTVNKILFGKLAM